MKFCKSLLATSVLLAAFSVQAKNGDGSFESKSQLGGSSIGQPHSYHWSNSNHSDIARNNRFDGAQSGEFAQAIATLSGQPETGVALDMVSISAIPEPETYAMLLVGLGLIGTILRRRNIASKG